MNTIWSHALSSQLEEQVVHIIRRDVTPGFVATVLIIWLNAHKIIRPGMITAPSRPRPGGDVTGSGEALVTTNRGQTRHFCRGRPYPASRTTHTETG